MKQKVFTLLTLLVLCVTGASAAYYDLSFTATKTIAAGGEIWWTTKSNIASANSAGWCSVNTNGNSQKYGNITPSLSGDTEGAAASYTIEKEAGVLVKGGNTPSNLTTSKKAIVFKVTNTTAITAYAATTSATEGDKGYIRWYIYNVTDGSTVVNGVFSEGADINKTATITKTGLDASKTYIVDIEGGWKSTSTSDGNKQDMVVYAVKFAAPESTTPTIAASDVNITEDATDAGEIAFSLDKKETSGTVTAAEKVEADWLTLGAVGEGTVPFTATANTGAVARTATVTLTYTYNTSETVTKDVTITQEADVKGTAIIKAELTSNTAATVTGSIGGTANVSVQNTKDADDGYKFGGEGNSIGITLESGNFRAGDIINIYTTTAGAQGTIAIYDTDKSTILYNTGTKGNKGDNTFTLPAAVNNKNTIYICRTASNTWNGYVKYIEVSRPNAVVTLNASGYATYSKATDFTFEGAKAYKMALNESAKTIAGTEVSGKIAAGEGILLKGEANAPVAIMETTGAAALVDNDLKGSTKSDGSLADKPTYCYVLSGDTFKKFTGGTLTANKAFFAASGDLAGHALTMTFDDGETTAIKAVEAKKVENGVFYNLAGQQVAQPTKGLYIVNGRKVIVK